MPLLAFIVLFLRYLPEIEDAIQLAEALEHGAAAIRAARTGGVDVPAETVAAVMGGQTGQGTAG